MSLNFSKLHYAANSGAANTGPGSGAAQTGSRPSFNEIALSEGKLSQLEAQKAKPVNELSAQGNSLKNNKIFEPEELIRTLDIKPGFKVADFGCGAGNIVLPLARHAGSKVEIYGVDVQKDLLIKMLREAKSIGLKNVFAVWGDLDKPGGSKLPDAQFDLLLIVNTLFQLENKTAALKEAFRILKPGGHLCIVEWAESDLPLGPRKDNILPKNVILNMATELGFLFTEESKLGEHHFKLDFNKMST